MEAKKAAKSEAKVAGIASLGSRASKKGGVPPRLVLKFSFNMKVHPLAWEGRHLEGVPFSFSEGCFKVAEPKGPFRAGVLKGCRALHRVFLVRSRSGLRCICQGILGVWVLLRELSGIQVLELFHSFSED